REPRCFATIRKCPRDGFDWRGYFAAPSSRVQFCPSSMETAFLWPFCSQVISRCLRQPGVGSTISSPKVALTVAPLATASRTRFVTSDQLLPPPQRAFTINGGLLL